MKEIGMLSEKEILESADDRIQKHRMGDVIAKVIDSEGNPVPDAESTVQQTRHEFLFGCNIFMLGQYKDDEKNAVQPPIR
jgi:endo-1,4-beta-xylanase